MDKYLALSVVVTLDYSAAIPSISNLEVSA